MHFFIKLFGYVKSLLKLYLKGGGGLGVLLIVIRFENYIYM